MNKYFNKQTLVSFILGGILFSSVGVFAATQLNVTPNQYPIKVNNKETDIEGYNIEGRTYLQLRDTTEILNAELTFEDNTILIDTNTSETETTPNEIPTMIPNITPIIIPTPTSTPTNNESEVKDNMQTQIINTVDNLKVYYYDTELNQYNKTTGTKYIKLVHILEKYKPQGYILEVSGNVGILIKNTATNEKEILLNNIPLENIELSTMINYDYYLNNILPLLK